MSNREQRESPATKTMFYETYDLKINKQIVRTQEGVSSHPYGFLTFPVLLLAAWVCSSCAEEPPVADHLNIAIDVSDPNRFLQYADLAFRLQRNVPESTEVRFLLFAHEVQTVHTSRPIRDRDRFNQYVASEFQKKLSGFSERNTETGTVFAVLAKDEFKGIQHDWVITDGGVESVATSDTQPFKDSFQKLAANTNVKRVAVIGVLREHSDRWDTWLKPLGNKVLLRRLSDAEDVINNPVMEASR